MQGAVLRPEWEQMIPIGAAATTQCPSKPLCRSRATGLLPECEHVGELSTEARVITKKLGANLGQVIDKTIQELIDAQRIDQEKIERFNEDARVASEAAADATKKANDAMAAAIAHADAIGAIVADLTEADEWEAGKTYPVGDFTRHDGKLYRALRENTDAEPGASRMIGSWWATSLAWARRWLRRSTWPIRTLRIWRPRPAASTPSSRVCRPVTAR